VGRFAGEAFLGAIERGFETVSSERLQKIIHGMDFEGLDGVPVEGGDEDYAQIVADQFENFEAIELGHLDIEKEQIGFQFGDGLDRFEAVGALSDKFDLGMRAEEFAEDLASELFVVNNHGADFLSGFAVHVVCEPLSAGKVSATR